MTVRGNSLASNSRERLFLEQVCSDVRREYMHPWLGYSYPHCPSRTRQVTNSAHKSVGDSPLAISFVSPAPSCAPTSAASAPGSGSSMGDGSVGGPSGRISGVAHGATAGSRGGPCCGAIGGLAGTTGTPRASEESVDASLLGSPTAGWETNRQSSWLVAATYAFNQTVLRHMVIKIMQ